MKLNREGNELVYYTSIFNTKSHYIKRNILTKFHYYIYDTNQCIKYEIH